MTKHLIEVAPIHETGKGAGRVLTMSTIAFTLMFAVWLMFGILGIPIQKELGISDEELSWIAALAVLNGSMWRLPAGIIADRIGGRKVTLFLLFACAVPAYLVSLADNYTMLLVLAFLVGFAGNLFSVGTTWNSAWHSKSRQGLALGVFGAGNVGASVTKFIGPVLITTTAGSTFFLGIQGGWRLIPVIYAVLLVITGVATWLIVPRVDRAPGTAKPVSEMLKPLSNVRVWRFSVYYVAVFGAYVALSAWLPKYYVDNFDIDLALAGLLTATFIFPASLLRPVGGWMSDRWGARKVMYWTFALMLVTSGILMMPNGHITIVHPDGSQTQHLHYSMQLPWFVLVVFLLGCAMGFGKAAVFKHIPEYFPENVGSVGGLVGTLGGLGGFILPPLFAYSKTWSGFPSSTFFVIFVLTVICAAWMHITIVRMLHEETPQLAGTIERPMEEATQ
ncbi:nitrate/nitrite transporter [Tessaracoccus sp. ZS01]|uniref:MFS transporter n=1 Tax=Tessaracoccus sp. ZS01 TaxID=1906324 RepID=UPI001E4A0CA4|nr:nitrate/nitrite transporter [Tessaracoccus sp. ZS01]